MNLTNKWTTWFEIPVIDINRAGKFYESIFQMKVHHLDLGGLQMAVFPNSEVGCALCRHEAYSPSANGVLVYMNANPDLSQVLDRVEQAGGKVLRKKSQISPEQGYMALFTDTEGNRLGLRSEN